MLWVVDGHNSFTYQHCGQLIQPTQTYCGMLYVITWNRLPEETGGDHFSGHSVILFFWCHARCFMISSPQARKVYSKDANSAYCGVGFCHWFLGMCTEANKRLGLITTCWFLLLLFCLFICFCLNLQMIPSSL